MKSLKETFGDPTKWRHFHAAMTLVWAASVIPTLLWWRNSVLWIALLSVWANMAAHFGAWQGARAEESNQ